MGKYNVPAVERALKIIELLAESQAPQRLTTLGENLAIPKTTVLMILTTLETNGYVQKTADGKYQLTTKLVELGSQLATLKEIAREHLEHLADDVKLTVHLSAYMNNNNVVIDKVNGPGFIQFSTYDGKRQSFHATSSGKAMLAYLPTEEIRDLVPRIRLQKFTEKTIGTFDELMVELEQVRNNGYATEDEEEEVGVRCIGAPIYNALGKVVAAVSVTGVVTELNFKSVHVVAKKVRDAADTISHNLSMNNSVQGNTLPN